jgi:hypothetical protein
MLFVILVGGIDLCVGSTAAMASCFMLKILTASGNSTFGLLAGFGVAMALCVLLGLFHGIQAAYFGLPAFVVTLATQYAIYGAMLDFTGGSFIYNKATDDLFYQVASGRLFGIPMTVVWFLIAVIVEPWFWGVPLSAVVFSGRRLYQSRALWAHNKRYTVSPMSSAASQPDITVSCSRRSTCRPSPAPHAVTGEGAHGMVSALNLWAARRHPRRRVRRAVCRHLQQRPHLLDVSKVYRLVQGV